MIIGGSDGLGKELVKEVFLKGAFVTIVGRDQNKMQAIIDELDPKNDKSAPLIRYFAEDVTLMSSSDVEKLIRQAEKYFGQLEMFIYCAAKSEPVMFISSDLNKFKNHLDLNFMSVVKFLIPVSKRMVLRKTQGRICLVGDSNATQSSIPGMTPYACSKSALEQLAFQLHSELEAHGIKIHYMLPPTMSSEFLEQQKS